MTIQQLQYFLAAARAGSFSAAAEELHMAQPSLSEQVRRLEDELGVALFIRLGRGLALTDAGRTLVPHAEGVVASLEQAAESVREVRSLSAGVASFGTFGDAGHYFLGDLVAAFRTEHPAVRIRVIGQNSSEVADMVRQGRLEAGLVVLPVDDDGLEVRPAMEEEVLYASVEPDRTRRPVTIERFAKGPLILYDAQYGWDDPTRRQLADRAQRAGLRIEPQIEIEELNAALELAARGLGDTIVARSVVFGRRFPRKLHTAPFQPALRQTFAFIHRRGARLSPATQEIIGLTYDRIAELHGRLEAEAAA
jgi:DNA-binding transcriptional LysR family regulator